MKEAEREDELVWKPRHLSAVHLKLTLVEVRIERRKARVSIAIIYSPVHIVPQDDAGDVIEYVLEEDDNEVRSPFTAHLTTGTP